nr:hypothetical protein [uncultured Marinifilum sp.]
MNKYFKLYSNCIPIKGYVRSIIYDLGDNDYYFIPNSLFEIINGNSLVRIDQNNEDYINYLIKNNLGFTGDNVKEFDCFPNMDLSYKSPYALYSVIYRLEKNTCQLKSIIKKLELFQVKNICLIVDEKLDLNFIANLCCEVQESDIEGVKLILNEEKDIDLESLLKNYLKINEVTLCSSRENKIEKHFDENTIVVYTTKSINEEIDYNKVGFEYFFVNKDLFTESLAFNPYYNKKIIILSNGDIIESLKSSRVFGNVFYDELISIFKNKELLELWHTSKGNIQICKDCEFRFMCLDSRVPNNISNKQWGHSESCHYNPYIAKWKDEEGYIPVEECGAYNEEGKFVVYKEKVDSINLQLWE